ncbi:hypothetical protein HDU67_008016 [Dinochytrium kinnereticum]|nr:hypothetical protein HDU67_008016 [Dinochytrium kinnereticum]
MILQIRDDNQIRQTDDYQKKLAPLLSLPETYNVVGSYWVTACWPVQEPFRDDHSKRLLRYKFRFQWIESTDQDPWFNDSKRGAPKPIPSPSFHTCPCCEKESFTPYEHPTCLNHECSLFYHYKDVQSARWLPYDISQTPILDLYRKEFLTPWALDYGSNIIKPKDTKTIEFDEIQVKNWLGSPKAPFSLKDNLKKRRLRPRADSNIYRMSLDAEGFRGTHFDGFSLEGYLLPLGGGRIYVLRNPEHAALSPVHVNAEPSLSASTANPFPATSVPETEHHPGRDVNPM